MKKSVLTKVLTGFVMLFTAAVISFGALTLSWFLGPNIQTEEDDYLDGDIGLRNYFFSGDGSLEQPFEIVSPIHFYNLTRLQNLGLFPNKKYFEIGHVFDIEGQSVRRCINRYDSNGDPIYEPFLDMNEFSHSKNVLSIGGEGSPFVGTVNGYGVPIRNLKISGNPEDVGVFGYVAHEGSIVNLVFDNLEVCSLGYNSTVGDDDNTLFSVDIDDIFNSASYLATDTSLALYQYNAQTGHYDPTNLKKLNGVSGTQLANINSSANLYGSTTYYNAYFKPTFPTTGPFTYAVRSSSPLIKEVGTLNLNGNGDTDIVIDVDPLRTSSQFNSGSNIQADAKIYLVASVEVDGFVFSRVIQSYTIEFYSNGHVYADQQFGAGIYCDYIIQQDPTDRNTNYHHGNNIGLVAGHVDGNMKDCYVFNGKFTFNETGYHPIASETDTGLVGEIGRNVANSLDPEIGLVVNGDTGIMNFSKIYSMIRTYMTGGATIKGGYRTPTGKTDAVNFVSYRNFINAETIGNYIDYLRYYDGEKENNEFITKVNDTMPSVWGNTTAPSSPNAFYNSVDFLWNNVIQDEDDVDRGLGVFKIVSSYNAEAKVNPYGQYMVNNIGDCRILNGTPKTKVYFSTCEYDHVKGGSWSPLRATTLPSYSDILSFEYPFSRDYNYVFELDLSQMAAANGKDYMYNTDSPFLTNYLNSRLIDKYGSPVTPGSARFGFMFRSSENEILSSLSSYMPVGVPGLKQPFGTDSQGRQLYYPSNSIVFRIDNANGANVSVVGNGADITIYGYDPYTASANDEHHYEYDRQPLYSMKSSNSGSSDIDGHRYFTYNVATGATGTETVQNNNDMKDGGALYGHIFKLPQGDYVIGAKSNTANIYFLGVQGQSEGSIGANDLISVGGDAIEDVDFLLEAPTLANFPTNLVKALFSFKGTFNTTHGEFYMEAITVSDKKYMRLRFGTSSTFVTYVLTYSRHLEHTYYINEEYVNEINHTYTPQEKQWIRSRKVN